MVSIVYHLKILLPYSMRSSAAFSKHTELHHVPSLEILIWRRLREAQICCFPKLYSSLTLRFIRLLLIHFHMGSCLHSFSCFATTQRFLNLDFSFFSFLLTNNFSFLRLSDICFMHGSWSLPRMLNEAYAEASQKNDKQLINKREQLIFGSIYH